MEIGLIEGMPEWKEIKHRLGHPSSISSHAWNSFRGFTAPLFPSRFNTLFQKVKPFTMVSYARLHGLYDALQRISRDRIPGDIVECGVAHGGSAALLGLTLKEVAANRHMWLFDTFSGIPAPTSEDPDYDVAEPYTGKFGSGLKNVQSRLALLGISQGVTLVPGLFQDTVVQSQIASIALLHLDGDWYESVKICLEAFYDRVPVGGVIQFDDYGYWAGARKAVDEFFLKRNITPQLIRLDYSGRQLIKN